MTCVSWKDQQLVDVNASIIGVDSHSSLLTLATTTTTTVWQQMLVTTFGNGCRPRYSCVQLVQRASSVLHYRLSQSEVNPPDASYTIPRDIIFLQYLHLHVARYYENPIYAMSICVALRGSSVGFPVCFIMAAMRLQLCMEDQYILPRFFLSFFSNAVLGDRRAELNQTLPHVRKWARFENRLKFGGNHHLNRGVQKPPIRTFTSKIINRKCNIVSQAIASPQLRCVQYVRATAAILRGSFVFILDKI